jgi:hypothetical protein
MGYYETNSRYGISSCPCGKSSSSAWDEYSTEGNHNGDWAIASIPYNLGDKYSYCSDCKKYWYDSNAKEWNELSAIRKFFYAIGFWKLLVIFPPWIVFEYIKENASSNGFVRFFQYIFYPILGIPLTIFIDLIQIFLTLLFNIPFLPFVIIFHWVEIHNSKKRIKYGSPNKEKYFNQLEKISIYEILRHIR